MKRSATPRKQPVSSSSSRRYKYTKVLDNRKHAIRSLWRRNGNFLARITVEDTLPACSSWRSVFSTRFRHPAAR
jgi:hypothetical protein